MQLTKQIAEFLMHKKKEVLFRNINFIQAQSTSDNQLEGTVNKIILNIFTAIFRQNIVTRTCTCQGSSKIVDFIFLF